MHCLSWGGGWVCELHNCLFRIILAETFSCILNTRDHSFHVLGSCWQNCNNFTCSRSWVSSNFSVRNDRDVWAVWMVTVTSLKISWVMVLFPLKYLKTFASSSSSSVWWLVIYWHHISWRQSKNGSPQECQTALTNMHSSHQPPHTHTFNWWNIHWI